MAPMFRRTETVHLIIPETQFWIYSIVIETVGNFCS